VDLRGLTPSRREAGPRDNPVSQNANPAYRSYLTARPKGRAPSFPALETAQAQDAKR
jgi:hypothetical protein